MRGSSVNEVPRSTGPGAWTRRGSLAREGGSRRSRRRSVSSTAPPARSAPAESHAQPTRSDRCRFRSSVGSTEASGGGGTPRTSSPEVSSSLSTRSVNVGCSVPTSATRSSSFRPLMTATGRRQNSTGAPSLRSARTRSGTGARKVPASKLRVAVAKTGVQPATSGPARTRRREAVGALVHRSSSSVIEVAASVSLTAPNQICRQKRPAQSRVRSHTISPSSANRATPASEPMPVAHTSSRCQAPGESRTSASGRHSIETPLGFSETSRRTTTPPSARASTGVSATAPRPPARSCKGKRTVLWGHHESTRIQYRSATVVPSMPVRSKTSRTNPGPASRRWYCPPAPTRP